MDSIGQFLDKHCVNENSTIRTIFIILKYLYKTTGYSVNFIVNTYKMAIKVFNKFKDFIKNNKEMLLFLSILAIVYFLYKTIIMKFTEIPKITTQYLKNLSSNIPNNLSELNDKIWSAFSTKEIIKNLLKKSTEIVNMLYNQIVDSSKSVINSSNKVVNSTTPVIKDTSYQIYSTISSTVVGSIPYLQRSPDKIQSVVNSNISAILNNEKLNGMAHSVKDTVSNTTKKTKFKKDYSYVNRNIQLLFTKRFLKN